ncbi:unnamed protein product [Gordionus sp. m RMFG-2023]|uniref:mediator of RNA polymerase II transcription subunit 21-like isoform X3 n=1 Tax=Gordionus sp. m RMFG-2023 TaxID=3053472 RepID=UPI0030E2FE2A
MSDLITQLQDALNELAETFCNAIGVIQQQTGPSQLKEKYCEIHGLDKNSELSTSILDNFAHSNIQSAELSYKNYANTLTENKLVKGILNIENQPAQQYTIVDNTGDDKNNEPEDKNNILLFSKLIAKNVKDISLLIGALPPDNVNDNKAIDTTYNLKDFQELQNENDKAAIDLRLTLQQAEELLSELQKTLLCTYNEN